MGRVRDKWDHAFERGVFPARQDVLLLGSDARFERWHEKHVNRFFGVSEMDALLRGGGFEVVDTFAGYSEAGRVDDATWHVLTLARATEPQR
jgi:hypothetical protein